MEDSCCQVLLEFDGLTGQMRFLMPSEGSNRSLKSVCCLLLLLVGGYFFFCTPRMSSALSDEQNSYGVCKKSSRLLVAVI